MTSIVDKMLLKK